MMNKNHQQAIFEHMAQPDVYPHPADSVKIIETHISKVFIAGDYVYKIKKPLDLGFLDFTTLEKRKFFCGREVTLNRRLTTGIYLDVVGICVADGGYRLNGTGTPVEYAVRMRRLPEDCAMKYLIRNGRIHINEIERLAGLLIRFYSREQDTLPENMDSVWEIIRGNCEENFIQTEQYAGKLFDHKLFQDIRLKMSAFMERRRPLFFRRMKESRFMDCHGDLRTGHIYYTDVGSPGDDSVAGGIQIIDCIEFNDRFRYQDVASDLAFLVMDMEFMGYAGLAEKLIAKFVQSADDFGIYLLIDFYKCYRALVRLKVNSIRLQAKNLSNQSRTSLLGKLHRYLRLADHYIRCAVRPRLWVVCGMPASGKSTIAGKLGKTLMVRVLNSDVIRKKMFGQASMDPSKRSFEAGMYSKTATARTYGKMFHLALEEIENGASVVLDATFSSGHFRRELVCMAENRDAGIIFIECMLPEALLKERLRSRETDTGISDARLAHYASFKKQFEPLGETGDDIHITVNTEESTDDCIRRILSENYKICQRGVGCIS